MTNEPLGVEPAVRRFLVRVVVDLEVAANDEHAATAAAETPIRSTTFNGAARRLDHSIRRVEKYWRARMPSDAI